MFCKYCEKECKNENSLRQHSVRCKKNPNGIITKPTYGRKGKRHSEETKNKLREKAFKQHKEGNFKPLLKGFGSFSGKKHSEETKEKISNSMKGNRNANHRGDRQSFYKDIRMDSSWEVKVAKYFDDNQIEWSYGKLKFILSDGRYYFPDFEITKDNKIIIVEVKGYFRESNKQKFNQFKIEYPNSVIELWDKAKLKELKII